MRRVLISLLGMVGGFALALGVARAGAGADAGLRAAFVPRSDCAAPCWEGIRPGSTSAADAERLLRQHRWIDDLSAGPSIISWHWSEQAPGYIDSARQGVLYVEHARVWTVRVPLRVPFGDIWALFGPPSQSLLVRPVSRSTAYQIVSYEDIGISVVSSLSCPAGPGVFWASLTTLHLGALTHSDLMNSSPYAVFEQPGWWRWLHTCRRVQLR